MDHQKGFEQLRGRNQMHNLSHREKDHLSPEEQQVVFEPEGHLYPINLDGTGRPFS